MTSRSLFFSFDGRINRATYWTRGLPVLIVMGVIVNLIVLVEVKVSGKPGPVSMGLSLLGLWPSLAVTVKRLHDRDRSAWFLFILLVPVIGGIWLLAEVWFLPGTDDPNRFGDPPTGGPVRPVVAGLTVVALALVMAVVGYESLFRGQIPAQLEIPPATVSQSVDALPPSLAPDSPSGQGLGLAPLPEGEVPSPPSASE